MPTPDTRPPTDLITVGKAAEVLAVHPATVYRLVRSGRLRAWRRLGGRIRVSRGDVQALLEPVQVPARGEVPPVRGVEEEAARGASERLKGRGYRPAG